MKQYRVFGHRVRRIILAVAISQYCAGTCLCQQPVSTPIAFEVASIKLGSRDYRAYAGTFGTHIHQGRASYIGLSLKSLLVYAYDLNYFQVSGPGWIENDRYVIEAKFPEGATLKDEKKMLQELLRERFKLAFHTEKKEETAYQLIVGKQGAKLKPSSEDSSGSGTDAPLKPGEQWVGEGPEKYRELNEYDAVRGVNHTEVSRMSMNELAKYLTATLHIYYRVGYLVVDRTGLEGYYQVSLDYSPIQATASEGGDASDPQGTDVLDRSLDALGLRLKLQKTPVDVYVVDHAEQPSAN